MGIASVYIAVIVTRSCATSKSLYGHHASWEPQLPAIEAKERIFTADTWSLVVVYNKIFYQSWTTYPDSVQENTAVELVLLANDLMSIAVTRYMKKELAVGGVWVLHDKMSEHVESYMPGQVLSTIQFELLNFIKVAPSFVRAGSKQGFCKNY